MKKQFFIPKVEEERPRPFINNLIAREPVFLVERELLSSDRLLTGFSHGSAIFSYRFSPSHEIIYHRYLMVFLFVFREEKEK